MKEKSVSAIIVAAGSGSRMKSAQKKQYMELAGKPVLSYSILAMEKSSVEEVILVVSQEDIPYTEELIRTCHAEKVTKVVAGGRNRYDSVLAGLKEVTGKWTLIHDGARPCISVSKIEELITALKERSDLDGAILAVPVKDTIKICDEKRILDSPNRDTLYAAQTPQGFVTDKLKYAYQKMMEAKGNHTTITDDAMVIQQYGNGVVEVVDGDYKNIKITTPEDLILAKRYFE